MTSGRVRVSLVEKQENNGECFIVLIPAAASGDPRAVAAADPFWLVMACVHAESVCMRAMRRGIQRSRTFMSSSQ